MTTSAFSQKHNPVNMFQELSYLIWNQRSLMKLELESTSNSLIQKILSQEKKIVVIFGPEGLIQQEENILINVRID
jgi:16S rRNA U1498 N3-methylase RsmE